MSPTFHASNISKAKQFFLADIQKQLLIIIADLAFEINSEVPPMLKKLIDKMYFDIVCQGVFYSFFYAFPKSRTKLNKDFKCEIFKIISKLFKGCEVSYKSRFIKNWRFIEDWYLNLGAGNLLAETSGDENALVDQKLAFPKIFRSKKLLNNSLSFVFVFLSLQSFR